VLRDRLAKFKAGMSIYIRHFPARSYVDLPSDL